MNDLTDDEIGGYYDRMWAEWLREIPVEHQQFQRAKYVRDVRANPEAMRQLREHLDSGRCGGAMKVVDDLLYDLFMDRVFQTRHARWAIIVDGRTYTSRRRRSLRRTWLKVVTRHGGTAEDRKETA